MRKNISNYLRNHFDFKSGNIVLDDKEIQTGIYLLVEGEKTREEISKELRKYDVFLEPKTLMRIILGYLKVSDFEAENEYRNFLVETRRIPKKLDLM